MGVFRSVSRPLRNRIFRRILWLVPLALVATGCGSHGLQGGNDAKGPTTLIVSDAWVSANQGTTSGGAAGGSPVQARIASLEKAIKQLRAETDTGWIGRQDDVTGYLADLSGGSWQGTPSDFMDSYGSPLFGIDSSSLQFGDPETVSLGTSTTKAAQVSGGIPVLDGSVVLTTRAGSDGVTRVTNVHGRVFPGITVSTTPHIGPDQAVAVAEGASGGKAASSPLLFVVPNGSGVLTWAVTINGSDPKSPLSSGIYFIDANSGDIVSVRPASSDGFAGGSALGTDAGLSGLLKPTGNARTVTARLRGQLEPDPNSVDISGKDPEGDPLTGHGVKVQGGVALVDTTVDDYSAKKKSGGIFVYDASGLTQNSQLPGKLAVSPSTTVSDPELMAAEAYSRDIYDYYKSMGHTSWDGHGAPMVSSVHFGKNTMCNAFFSSSLNPPEMVYGPPCVQNGQQISGTFIDIDIAAHEVTHGVTASTAALIYSGQSGALNESFSDYFGNVIGNKVKNRDGAAIGDDNCAGFQANQWCQANPDGTFSLRYMLNGTTYDDYLRLLDPGLRLTFIGAVDQDEGGVHENSNIWNNALWTIRTTLAKIDNKPGNTSPLAQAFDKVVYTTLTTKLTPTSGFLDAASAVLQTISESNLDPVVLRTAQQVFQSNHICANCTNPDQLLGQTVTNSPQTQMLPSVSGDHVAWLDMSSGQDVFGFPAQEAVGAGSPTLGSNGNTIQVAYAGDALVGLDVQGNVTRFGSGGAGQVLQKVPVNPALTAGLAGSDAGAAWMNGTQVSFADPTGKVTSAPVATTGGRPVIAVGTGGGTVALGTAAGAVLAWKPGGQVTSLGSMPAPVVSVTAYGGSVFAIDINGDAELFSGGKTFQVSQQATPFGSAMSSQYAVWAQAVGPLQSKVIPGGTAPWPDTDLYLLSLKTGKVFDLGSERGQQGFPAISGDRLVWQDSAFDGDDILTAVLPDGL
jgi:Zn-dependent metalloprotease